MKKCNKGFSLSALIVAIAAFLGLGTPLAIPNIATSTPDQNEYLSAQQTLELAQKAITNRLYGLNLQCIDFDGIRENGVVTYNVFVKASAACSPSILKEPASVTIDLNTGAASVTVGHPVTPAATQVNQPRAIGGGDGPYFEWNTYTNTKYNVSFKYPSDWKILDQNNDVVIAKVGNGPSDIFFVRTIGDIDLDRLNGGQLALDNGWSTSKNGIFGGYERMTYNKANNINIIMDASSPEMRAIEDQMLTSFITLNQPATSKAPSNANQSITVLSPAAGSILKAGQPYSITWAGHWERGDETFSINTYPVGSDVFGTIAGVSFTQASCSGSGMGHSGDLSTCTYTWTPTGPTPNLRIGIFNKNNGNDFGYSGTFSVVQ